MKTKINIHELGVSIELADFCPKGGVGEFHAILHVEPNGDSFEGQYKRLIDAEKRLLDMPQLSDTKVVFKRYFYSDIMNQLKRDTEAGCAVSYIQQPPLDGSKIALWVYLIRGAEVVYGKDVTTVEYDGCKHSWCMNLTSPLTTSYEQTDDILKRYKDIIAEDGCTLADNCIRTWFYVRDVDIQYKGMVVARREFFANNGLTPDTHYIASTGIGGVPSRQGEIITFDGYCVKGFEESQRRHLYAPTHLNRTIDYGVTFERGTMMDYSDRRHVFISGTASIDNKGEVVSVGDIVAQTKRMIENVEALLAEAETTFSDVMQVIVYLRDMADYTVVRSLMEKQLPDTPYVITLAPVCRPAWLIEMECMAVKSI